MEKLICRENFLASKRFLAYLSRRVGGRSQERYRFYLRHLLMWAMDVPLYDAKKINPDFPSYIASVKSPAGKQLAHETQKKIFQLAKKFFSWAKMEYPSQYRKIEIAWMDDWLKIRPSACIKAPHEIDLDLLNEKDDEVDINIKYVSLHEAIALATLPRDEKNLARWRDCAMAAFLFLTGARAEAATSIPIGAVHFDRLKIRQWPELGVQTKNGKSATTFMHKISRVGGSCQIVG